jgi:hypothetical protein
MSWKEIIKEEPRYKELKEALNDLLFEGERKEEILVSRKLLHMIWRIL